MRKCAAVRQKDVMSVLNVCKRPMTAYQILGQLQVHEPDIAPPTVYRTLLALTDQGRVHRLETNKAFVPCRCSHVESVPVLAICEDCGAVEEYDGSELLRKLTDLTDQSSFHAVRHIVEIQGLCGTCVV